MIVVETERLILRHQTVQDAAFILELLNDPSWIRNIGDRGVRTLEDARTHIIDVPMNAYAALGFGFYLTELKDGGIPLGICGLAKRDFMEEVDIGFAFLPRYWGKGYAYEAASAVMGYAKEVIGLKRLAAITALDNRPSAKLLEKLGLKDEGTIPYAGTEEQVRLFAVDL
ncbi:GNAT family N-acetyltransferase [Paenibacillus sp. GCM10023248]|uniref:GNAT family N-acetyltransferase n=1 Tax=Bacillales TaxID=1385 RepID=UPI002379DB80|nr:MULTISPECIES: GNAT family N-acetyltransferase [Bacillales]MDD9269011.1 GNAT family N-acetyltransferase [Paenibacillus sp. MAHUQ-63]MDR6884989.1 RimJ/RimL family protein N-acetyltransferase [Bacillus sp. 3255]